MPKCGTCGREMDYAGNDGVNGPETDEPMYVCSNADCGREPDELADPESQRVKDADSDPTSAPEFCGYCGGVLLGGKRHDHTDDTVPDVYDGDRPRGDY